ncbi:calcium uptake protein, mitochondrial-like [Andrographis paniculata]|uniref:calcium uptake protein, mitochondrial-like n=1 Tax=Andrographis paniculata TaxID=175694 RepID=UPI0021E845DA|nr:calcium uptake protein, mitochondrial-like [Andrographis paniculata]
MRCLALWLRKHTPNVRILAHQNLRNYYKHHDRHRAGTGAGDPAFLASTVLLVGSAFGLHTIYGGDSSVSYADSGSQLKMQPEKKPIYLFKDSYRRKVFFKYEKRIRTQSPPEKVFEYFASFHTPSGETYMTPADLMRAVVPVFPPSETGAVRGGFLKGELVATDLHCPPSDFFMLFDTNNDGLISFPEYIFFVTLLSIPESSFSVAFKMFDLDGDGGIDKDEFKKVMSLMRSQNRQGKTHRDGKRIGLKVSSGSIEDGGLVQLFFGKDGKDRLSHNRFVEFLRDLRDEMLRLEFAHYDHKSKGMISGKDFVLSMVASANIRYIDKFLDLVDDLDGEPSLRDLSITYEEFKNFAELRRRLEPFSIALFSYGKVNGLLSKKDFKRAAKQVCGISLTDRVIDLVFFVFDTNRDGSLSSDEFLRVLERRSGEVSPAREAGLRGVVSCWLDCTVNCSSKKLSMIQG